MTERHELRRVWTSLDNAVKVAEVMVDEGKKPDANGLILALLQVIAWELRMARNERSEG